MDALAAELAIEDIEISPGTQRHPDYALPVTDLDSHMSILNKEQVHDVS